jgi:uncharacterized protein
VKHVGWSILLFLAFTAAHAASFDCRKAQSKVEKLICGDEELSGLDESLRDVYQQRSKVLADSTQLLQDQRQWLKITRNACADVVCLKKAYVERINQIGLEIDENDQSGRSLALKCDFSGSASAPLQQVTIESAVFGRGEHAAIKEFSRDSGKAQSISFVVQPGELAECVYPSGFRVRVKVGEGMAYPYGECGADAPVFLSLWINERKAASRIWFAGHCREMNNEPPVTFRIAAKSCFGAAGTICTDFPDLNKYPVDSVEYPAPGKTKPKVGDMELTEGTGAICRTALDEIRKGYFGPSSATKPNDGTFARPEWKDVTVELPQELTANGLMPEESRESTYDFDNDGNLDRVISLSSTTHYMDATVLLVQPGTSPKLLAPAHPLFDKSSTFIPCQVTSEPSDLHECPPLSQKWDEAGFVFGGRTSPNAIRFRARYADVVPFMFQGTSYVFVQSRSEDTANYFAILKPLPKRKFEYSCLFRQVVENY